MNLFEQFNMLNIQNIRKCERCNQEKNILPSQVLCEDCNAEILEKNFGKRLHPIEIAKKLDELEERLQTLEIKRS